MKKAEELLELIGTLSMPEKTYFKQYAARFRENTNLRSIQLFDQLLKSGSADIRQLRSLLPSAEQKHLPVYCYRLYTLLTDSLCSFHSGKLTNSRIMELLKQAEVFYNRNLLAQAEKALKRARSIAKETEKYTFQAEINEWERRIIQTRLFQDVKEKDIIRLFEEEDQYAKKILKKNEYWKSASLMYLVYRKNGIARNAHEKNIYTKLIKKLALESQKSNPSENEAYIYYLLGHTRRFSAIADFQKTYDYSKELKSYFESRSIRIKQHPFIYVITYYNYLFAAHQLKRYAEFYKEIEMFKHLPRDYSMNDDHPVSNYINVSSINLELMFYASTGQFKKSVEEVIPRAGKLGQKEAEGNNMFSTWIYRNMGYHYFGIGDYKKALEWYNKSKNVTYSRDNTFYSIGRIFDLILHYELGHTDLLPYLLRSVYRDFYKRKKLYTSEKIILDFLRNQLSQVRNQQMLIIAFGDLYTKLLHISEDTYENAFLNTFDIISWLESKIQNKSFEEVIRGKATLLEKPDELK